MRLNRFFARFFSDACDGLAGSLAPDAQSLLDLAPRRTLEAENGSCGAIHGVSGVTQGESWLLIPMCKRFSRATASARFRLVVWPFS